MDNDIQDFVSLSSILIGVEADFLAPGLDPTNMKADCFGSAQKSDAAALANVLTIFRAHSADPVATIADLILNKSGDGVSFFAKAIMLSWLLGNWYDPKTLQAVVAGNQHGPIPSKVISPNAYQQSWTWKIAQAHAMGASNQSFGYWATQPPALDQFIGAAP